MNNVCAFNKKTIMVAFSGLFISSSLFAAGFEKNVLWSGKYQGRGGAATSSVNDSESLFFNPAGLAFLSGKGDVHLNFSPTFASFKGPQVADNTSETSKTGFSPIGGVTTAWRLNDNFVYGAGVFVSAGTQALFEGIQTPAGVGKSESSLSVIDLALGAAYKVTPQFSVGLSWKASYAKAELNSIIGGPSQLELTNLKKFDFLAFRVGAQYREEDFGFGINLRTPVKLKLKGDASVRPIVSPTPAQTDDAATVTAAIPMQIAVGADFKVTPTWKLFVDASWTNYSQNDKLDIETSFTAPFDTISKGDLPLKWNDQQVLRLGTDWAATEKLTLRAGYVLTSQVTPNNFARATFSSPGLGHSFTLGAGTKFGKVAVNGAVDYSFASGSTKGHTVASTPPYQSFAGKYSSHSYTAHLGAGYEF